MLEGISGVSTYAAEVDEAFWIVTGLTFLLFFATIGAMFYFAWRYRASRVPAFEAKNIHHNTALEITWTVIPTILLMVMFYYGMTSLKAMRTFPDEGVKVKVTGFKWAWRFEYENGKKTTELYVPVNQNVLLEMSAPKGDVTHSFYVPAFRVKEDVVPGITTRLWFNATDQGQFDIKCAEYCGTRHAYMLSKVVVIEPDKFAAWMASDKMTPFDKDPETTASAPAVSKGETLFSMNGCNACHSMEGQKLVGPHLNDVFGTEVTVTTNGEQRTIIRDEEYMTRSITDPDYDLVEGYLPGMMPGYKEMISPEDIQEIVKYLKGDTPPPAAAPVAAKPKIDGKQVSMLNGCIGCHSEDGSKVVGPSFKGIWMREVNVVEGGNVKTIVSDAEYLREAILRPNANIVEGYQPMMPPYEGVIKDEEVDALIEYFKELK